MKAKPSDIISVAALIAVIYGFGAATLIIPDKTFSEDENRMLQTMPEFSIKSLTSGKFTSDIADYFADQFPLRNLFVGAKSVCELAALKGENDGVVLGSDETLITSDYSPSIEQMRKNLAAIDRFAGAIGDIPFDVAVPGRTQDVLVSKLPELFPAAEQTNRVYNYLDETLKASTIDLLSPLRARADLGEYVYYRTDHHWTSLGAYYAYDTLMRSWGLEPYPIEHFERELVSDEFYGTTWSKAGMKWISPDTLEFFRYDGDDALTTSVKNGESFKGLYDRSYLSQKDKYAAFLSSNNGHVSVNSGKARERLVIIKDSFANSLAPFLSAHFELELLDLRYLKGDKAIDIVHSLAPDRILVLYSMDSLINTDSLTMLNFGLN